VPAGAHNFGLVGDPFAMSAAIFLLLGWNAVAGGVSAFFGAGHVLTPQYPYSRIPEISMHGYQKGMAAKLGIS